MSRPRVMGLMLALVTLLVYLPATRDGFLNYDDGDYVTENPDGAERDYLGGYPMGLHRLACQQLAPDHLAFTHAGL